MTRLLPPHQNQNLESIFFDENEFYKPKIPLQNTESKETISSGHETISSQPKTVRCVIQKDFEDGLKKFERSEEIVKVKKNKAREAWVPDQTEIDNIRLQNHLKWKKQKEEEYLLKKEAERLELQKKREEEMQLERIKKQKEKEKEEKIREWQEQKAREKEERKREEMIMKELEDELRKNPQKLDKDRLLEEWVKLKNRQKQLESEKKAQMQRKVEESKAIRQALAEISYQQWKEKAKGKVISLPKNGYQIFGPKPRPVVKEDWNNDFINGDIEEKSIPLRPSKSTISTFRQYSKSANDDYLTNSRKTPSNHNIKNTKSGTDVKDLDSNFENLRKLWALNSEFPAPNFKNQPVIKPRIVQSIPNKESNLLKKFESKTGSKYPQDSKLKGWGDTKFSSSLMDVLPNKKQMDLYLNGVANNKSDSDSDRNDMTLTHRIGESFPAPKKSLKIPNFSQLFHKRNFSSDGESPDETSNRRSRSHDKPTKNSSTPAPRVSSMPRTGPETQEEAPLAPRRGISQSMTAIARTNILTKQQPKVAPKSIKGTRRKSKPRIHKSPIKEERNRWKAKKSQVVVKKKQNSDSESENPKKIESKESAPAPVKNYLDDYLAIHILSSDDDGKDHYVKTYPLGPSRIQSVRNRVLKTQSNKEPKE